MHSSILSWKTPWTEVPSGLQLMGLQRVGQYSETEHEHLDTKKHKAKNSKELSESFVCE